MCVVVVAPPPPPNQDKEHRYEVHCSFFVSRVPDELVFVHQYKYTFLVLEKFPILKLWQSLSNEMIQEGRATKTLFHLVQSTPCTYQFAFTIWKLGTSDRFGLLLRSALAASLDFCTFQSKLERAVHQTGSASHETEPVNPCPLPPLTGDLKKGGSWLRASLKAHVNTGVASVLRRSVKHTHGGVRKTCRYSTDGRKAVGLSTTQAPLQQKRNGP